MTTENRTDEQLTLELEALRAQLAEMQAQRDFMLHLQMQQPAFLCLTRGPEHRVEAVNPAFEQLYSPRTYVGKTARDVFPELDGQGFFELLDTVYTTGEAVRFQEQPVQLHRQPGAPLETGYFNFAYVPVKSAEGVVEGIACHGVEVTEQVTARQRVEALAEALRSTNEELTSQAEELQSQGEELASLYEQAQRHAALVEAEVAAKTEELQASNEELVAQAEELQAQHQQLFALNDELANSRGTMQAVLNSATSGIVACEAIRDDAGRITDFRFTLANPTSEKMLFHTADEMVGETLLTLFPGNVESGLFDGYCRVTESGEPMEVETFYRDDRLEFWLNVSAVRAGDGVAITFTDITARKRVENELVQRNVQLAAQKAFAERIIDNVDTGVCFLDRDLVYREANPIYCKFLQMPREQIVDRHLFDVVPGGEDTILPIFRAALDEGLPHHVTSLPFSYFRPDGTVRQTYWDATYLPMTRDGSHEIDGVLVLATEVTARVENERWQKERLEALQQLANQRAFAERVLENVPSGVAYLDRELVFRFSNQQYASFIRMHPGEIVGRYLDDVLPGAVEQTGPWLREVMETGKPFENTSFRLDTYGPGGQVTQTFWDFVYYPDEADADGRARGVFVLANEISPRLQAEREREEFQRERIRALEEGEQLKNQFLSILSHELRTPINAIMGFGSVLDDEVVGPLTPDQRKYTSRILGGAETLLALINDLLDMSRIQAGKFQLTPRRMRIEDVVAEVANNLEPLAERKRLSLTVECAAELPMVDADPQRVTQILSNLVGKAIKFTHEAGRIAIAVSLEAAHLRCEVSDTGIGIAPGDIGKLFKPFTQLETGNTRSGSGTGLGLSISKALIDAHNGHIGVESTPGEGSMFWFTLPLDAVHSQVK
jgi:PAS domain S-box-containing protein